MSEYWESMEGEGTYESILQDIKDGKVEGIKHHHVDRKDRHFENLSTSECITDGENFLYLHAPCEGGRVGIKRWAGNKPAKIMYKLAEKYGLVWVHEEDLGLMHI